MMRNYLRPPDIVDVIDFRGRSMVGEMVKTLQIFADSDMTSSCLTQALQTAWIKRLIRYAPSFFYAVLDQFRIHKWVNR